MCVKYVPCASHYNSSTLSVMRAAGARYLSCACAARWLEIIYIEDRLANDFEEISLNAINILSWLLYRLPSIADSTTLRKLYTSLVRSHVEHAASLWDPHYN